METAFYFLPFHIDTECPKLESRKFITTTRTISVPIRPKVTETALLSLSKLQKKSLVYLTVCVCAVNDAAFMKFKECLSVFYVRYRPSVCLSSVVCLYVVHPTQVIELFGNFSMPFWYGGTRGVAEYSDFGPIERYISEIVQNKAKLVLITNRKSQVGTKLGDLG